MKKIIVIFLLLITNYSLLIAQSGWFVQYPQNSSEQLLKIQFLDINTGYVTGQYSIFKTTNSGINWINLTSTAGTGYYSLHFLNPNTGYIGGHYPPYGNGRILRTTNGGQNWIVQQTGIYDQGVYAIYAIDENTVIIGENFAGTNGEIFKSTNGGQNWVRVFYSAYKGIECIKFVNNSTGFACGTSFWKTTDAGNTWNEKTLPYSYHQYSICFLNENTGYIVGVNSIAKTTNGGDNWVVQTPNVNAYLMSVFFINVNTGMVVGEQGTILRTTNGGDNWLNISRPVYDYLGDIQMLNADTVFSTGWVIDSTYRSLVIKSYSGGITRINNYSNEYPMHFDLQQNYPNPFNPVTKIRFKIPSNVKSEMEDEYFPLRSRRGSLELGVGGMVSLKVFDITGREIQTLVNEKLNPGTYEVTFDGSNFASGVYFYQLRSENFIETKKFVLLK